MSGVNIVYSDSRIPTEQPITINARNEKLGSILVVILDDFSLSYQIVGNQLVLVKKDKLQGEHEITLYGYIKDKVSGEFLIGANVFVHDRSRGTATNENGFYSFKIPRKLQRVHFSYLGYKSEISDIYSTKDTMINIILQPDGLINEIVILDNLLEEEHESTSSKQSLHIDKIRSSNHLVGEADLFRYINNLPGVNTAAEGIGGLNIRGGSADQNLVLLDGVPVYNTGHALGIFSIFNANAIRSVDLYKGSIPARYAGRLSSVIDVHTKDGNNKKFAGDISLSTIAMQATLEGPIITDKSSFIVSFRRTFMDVWIKELTKYQNRERGRNGFSNYYFADFNTKLNFNLSKRTRLLLSAFHSNDDFENYTETSRVTDQQDINQKNLKWGNRLYSLRLHSQLGKSMYSRTTAYQTAYDFESFRNSYFRSAATNDTTTSFNTTLFESSITETGLRQEIDWLPSASHSVRLGVSYQARRFNPRVTTISDNNVIGTPGVLKADDLKNLHDKVDAASTEFNLFVEDDMDIGDGLRINAGFNYAYLYNSATENFGSPEPRISLLADGESLHFKAGITRMHQYMHLLTNNGLGLPSDIWLPANKLLEPQRSWMFNTSFGYRTNAGYKFGMEVFYKLMDDLTSYKEGGVSDINNNTEWASNVPVGKGTAYGFESYVEKVLGKTLFNINYTYSISDRYFQNLNNGNSFPFGLNRNHSLKFSFTYRLSSFSEFLVNWSYLSGNYYSQPINVTVNIGGSPVVIFPEKNNATFPVFHRLDVGFSFYNTYKWGRAKFFLGMYNAYNRNNPFYTELVRDYSKEGRFEFRQFSLLPLLPTISYSIAF
jgi:outer membrane receptor for ferrienterochelin and colicin